MQLRELIDKYIKEAEIHGNIDLGRRKVNKAAKELIKTDNYLMENEGIAKEVIDELLYSSSVSTQIWIAELAIDIKYREEEAVQLLKTLGNDKSIGILAMNARLRLAERDIVPITEWCTEK